MNITKLPIKNLGASPADIDHNTWHLAPGDEVVAVKDLDAAAVLAGMTGVVFEEGDGTFGPLVRWEHGGICNVYPGHVDKLPSGGGLRPSTVTLARTFIGEDPDLCGSTCGCCEGKRGMLKKLEERAPWVMAVLK